jgi:hypothetical protein
MTTATHDDTLFDPSWLRTLCDRAQTWVVETGGLTGFVEGRGRRGGPKSVPINIPTNGYVDLLFAFALASVGDVTAARELFQRGDAILTQETDEVHQWLLAAFRYRVLQAMEGKEHRGTLPLELLAMLESMPKSSRYPVERLRSKSRILEPDLRIDPYREWGRNEIVGRELLVVNELLPPTEIARRIEGQFAAIAESPENSKTFRARARVIVLTHSLRLAAIVGEEFARAALQQVPSVSDEFSKGTDQLHRGCDEGVSLLREAACLTKIVDQQETVVFVAERLKEFMKVGNLPAVTALAEPCLRMLRTYHREELADLCTGLENSVPQDNYSVLLPVAAAWLSLGQSDRPEQLFEKARTLMFSGKQRSQVETKTKGDPRFAVAVLYAEAIASSPTGVARTRLEEMFTQLMGVRDTFITVRLYALWHLSVIDAALSDILERSTPTPLRVTG